MPEHHEIDLSAGLFELAAAEGPYEEVLIVRSLGTAKIFINQKTLHIVPNGRLHRLTGEKVGWYTGVFQSTVDDPLTQFPPPPLGPYNKPSKIPDFRQRLHPTKAIWKFSDGSSIEAAGPANSYVIPLKDQSSQLVISIAMVIGRGTGRYEGARGTITSLGATWFPYLPGLPLQKTLKNGAIFEARGVHSFRITLEKDQAQQENTYYKQESDDIEDVDCEDDNYESGSRQSDDQEEQD